jgi:undecaprenol kinase/diacylglycerol kinase (ATP)
MKKFFLGFKYAWQGVLYAFSTQINFKFHSIAAISVIALGIYLDLDLNDWLWISAAIVLVLVAELFNTALEVLVDLVSPGFNQKAGRVKDLSSAAVLLTAILSFIIGLCVFIPKIF